MMLCSMCDARDGAVCDWKEGEGCKHSDERYRDYFRKHMNDGWTPVEDERLWDILFEEACVEGEQAKRIYNRLKETFGGERSEMDGKF